MKIFSSFTAIILVSLTALSNLAFADTKAIYDSPDGQIIIEYRDNNHIRFGMEDGAFMLVSAGEGYILTREKNTWSAMSVSQLQAMMPATKHTPEQTRLTALGQSENIAGFQGQRYRVEVGDDWGDGWRDEGEVVLSNDPATRPTTQAMMRMAELFSGMGQEAFFQQVEGVDVNQVGLLASEDMRLVSLSTEKLPDNIFKLPPNVQMQQMPTAAMAGQNASSEQGSSFIQELFQGAQDEAADETKRGTKEGVGDAVREGLRGLFN